MKVKLSSNKTVYNFCEPYIIAEIGANHNGDMDLNILIRTMTLSGNQLTFRTGAGIAG